MGFLGRQSKRTERAWAQLGTHHDLAVASDGGRGAGQRMAGTVTLRETSALWVVPDDGKPMFLSQLSAWGHDANLLQPGRWVYARFDPDRPERSELDRDRMTEAFGPRQDGKQRVMVPKDVSDAWFQQMRAGGRLTEAEFAAARAR